MRKNYRKRKFNKKRKSTYKIFFLILVGMTVGFAAINTTLQLIGTLNISRTTWDIHFENPTKTGGVTATKEVALKENDNTTVEYQVTLTNPGDYYEFTVDAKNDGTIDGMITNISNKVYENNVEVTLPAYLESTITYSDGKTIEPNHLLASTKKETYKVKVQYKTGLAADQLPDQEKTYNFRFTVTYMQADETISVNRLWILPTGRNKNNLREGDELCISDQCFKFIRYDGNDIVMISKYNLKVGNIYSVNQTSEVVNYEKIGEYTSSDQGYGLQSSEIRGYVYGESTWKGSVVFSKTNYWNGNTSTNGRYPGSYYPGPNYPTIYDATNYGGAPSSQNYSIAYYVEQYKNKLTNDYGQTIKNARLLTYQEATDLGCNQNNATCRSNDALTPTTTFWLGSASWNAKVWVIDSGNLFSNGISYEDGNEYGIGVRPVIVISKNNI